MGIQLPSSMLRKTSPNSRSKKASTALIVTVISPSVMIWPSKGLTKEMTGALLSRMKSTGPAVAEILPDVSVATAEMDASASNSVLVSIMNSQSPMAGL